MIRVKQHLAALVCVGDTIVLNTLRYHDEIAPTEALHIPSQKARAASITDKELKMATALVEGMSEPWKPQHYHDSYREDVMALIEKKHKAGKSQTITEPVKEKSAPSSGNVIDLVALLQKSLGKPAPAPRKRAAKTSTARPAARRKSA